MIILSLRQLFLCLILSLFNTSCSDSNSTLSYNNGHIDADGFTLEDEGGNEFYRQFQGTISGSINIGLGDTLNLFLHFLDYNQNKIENGVDESVIAVSENNFQIALVEVSGYTGSEDLNNGIRIGIIGVSEGETNFKLELMHGNHADYTSLNNVPIIVSSSLVIF